MKRSLFLLALETSAKAIRTGFASVGALADCGMPGPAVRFADALADAEAEIEVWEKPETPAAMQGADETDPGVGRKPAPTSGVTVDPIDPSHITSQSACRPMMCGDGPAVADCDIPESPPAGHLTSGAPDVAWVDYVTPAICDVLAEHTPRDCYYIRCVNSFGNACSEWVHMQDWREHVAPIIAARLEAVTLDATEK